ncbi:acetyl-CoA synthetase-like protein [Aspergillus avenaceus]|uniref:Acetyl-CoA synthetase-like protein n=1 Tax=Aspergillus avenaceus TaxID=36643 RepID=A0A5N6TY70_ASPAV|nr:acetyl-CoA synthetase-like protein [Aspergillus avenaceus]
MTIDCCFPDNPLFVRLLETAHKDLNHVVILDPDRGVEVSYGRLLNDILAWRRVIQKQLPREILDSQGMISAKPAYIGLLSSNSYEFIVAILAILAVGGAVMPLRAQSFPDGVELLIDQAKPVCLVATDEHMPLAKTMHEECLSRGNPTELVRISINTTSSEAPESTGFAIDQRVVLPSDDPSLLVLTSGSVGRPKAVVHSMRRLLINNGPQGTPEDTILLHRPPGGTQGLVGVVTALLYGIKTEILGEGQTSMRVWKRLRCGGVTMLTGSSVFWIDMMKYYNTNIAALSLEERDKYLQSAKDLRSAACAGSMPTPVVKGFWKKLLGGRSLKLAYGSTEVGGVLSTNGVTYLSNEACLGKPLPGVTVKLSNGDHGELLIKTPSMLLGYLNSPKQTMAALDEEGFYRSGDIAHISKGRYIMDGRAKADFIQYQNVQVCLLEVEFALKDLSYIAEGYIVPVVDNSGQHRVGALVRVEGRSSEGYNEELTLKTLRRDLAEGLALYKLPTVLRVLQEGEEAPLGCTGKFKRYEAAKVYFPHSEHGDITTLPSKVEVWPLEVGSNS